MTFVWPKLTFRIIQISTYFRICVMQNINLLNQCRQQFRIVQRMFCIRFLFTSGRVCRLIFIGICGQTWITETVVEIEKKEREKCLGRRLNSR